MVAYRAMAKHRLLALVVIVAFFVLLFSSEQISDKEKMRKLLCFKHEGDHQPDFGNGMENEGGRNVLQVNIDDINEEIQQLSEFEHTGTFEQRLPQVIIMGIRKCGTRALIEMLRMHPNIAATGPEVHFFDHNYEKGLRWYKEQMPYSYGDQITMEKTPGYFITDEAPERIYHMNSSIKLLAIVRDPTIRTISDYTQIMSHENNKYRKFPKFEEKVIVHGQIDTSYQAIKTSSYVNYVKNWYSYFNPAQIMFVDGAKLIVDPFPEIKRVEKFLGLPAFFTKHNFVYNETKGFYCLKWKTLKCLGDKKGQSHPDVDPKVLQQLQEFFRPLNKKLFRLIGREFDWN